MMRSCLGGKNLFQKAAHQFRRTVERVQRVLHFIPEFMILLTPMSSFLLGGGKFFFQAAVLHVHHKTVSGLAFQLGKFFFGQRIVAKQGLFAKSGNILCMDKSVFGKSGLFLNSGKLPFFFGKNGVGLGKRLLLLVGLGGQGVQTFLLPLDFELGDSQVFFGAAALTALHIRVPGSTHIVEEIVLQDAVRLLQNRLAVFCRTGFLDSSSRGLDAHFLLRLTCMTVSLTVPTSALSLQRFDHRICFSTTGT